MRTTRLNHWLGAFCFLAGGCLALSSAGRTLVVLEGEEQARLLGGGPAYECIGLDSCTVCVPPSGCSYWEYFGFVWGCACTSAGSEGCMTSGLWSFCTPDDGTTCDETGGGARCGGSAVPDDENIIPSGGTWICVPRCKAGGSSYCVACS